MRAENCKKSIRKNGQVNSTILVMIHVSAIKRNGLLEKLLYEKLQGKI